MTEQRYDCPLEGCPKPKDHFYVNWEDNVYYCQRCKRGGKDPHLILGVERTTLPPKARSIPAGVVPPPKYSDLSRTSESYLKARGFADSVLERIPVFDGEYGLVFLYPDEDYWQVRRWVQFTPPRWENPTNHYRKPSGGVTYHLGWHDTDTIVLVEGICDALAVAEFQNVAAVLSSTIHPLQAMSLAVQYSRCIVLLDDDVPTAKVLESTSAILPYFDWCKAIFPYNGEGDDPASLPKDVLERSVNA